MTGPEPKPPQWHEEAVGHVELFISNLLRVGVTVSIGTILVGVVAGATAGSRVLPHLDSRLLRIIFIVLLLVISGQMVWKGAQMMWKGPQ